MDTDEGRQHLQNMSLLEPGEWEAMVPGDRHSTIFWWIQLELVQLMYEYAISKALSLTDFVMIGTTSEGWVCRRRVRHGGNKPH